MRHPLLRASLFLVVAAIPALAAPSPGINMAWDQCYGDGGTSNKMFACNTNSGTERLVLSFVPDQRIENVSVMEMYVQLASDSPTLPNWWSMKNAGSCRPTALTLTFQPPDPASTECLDWGGSFFGGGGVANYNTVSPNTVTTASVVAVPAGLGLLVDPGIQYFTAALVISHTKTVGTGACSGCQTPVCILYSHMRLFVDGGTSFHRAYTTAASASNSNLATWQSGQTVGLQRNCNPATGLCTNSFNCSTQPTHSRANTWGAVKALYR